MAFVSTLVVASVGTLGLTIEFDLILLGRGSREAEFTKVYLNSSST